MNHSTALDVWYPSINLRYYINIQIFGIIHVIYNFQANRSILRQQSVSKVSKRKFLLFTMGFSTVFIGYIVFVLLALIFQDGSWLFYTVFGCIAGSGFLTSGFFYANPSVFFLPTRIYLLVIFDGSGNILYEKSFDPIPSSSAKLLSPALANIAKLIDTSFHQSNLLRLFSLPNRELLYEWHEDVGGVLIADADSRIFRNCLQVVLTHVDLLSDAPDQFETIINNVFAFYIEKLREHAGHCSRNARIGVLEQEWDKAF